MTTKVLPIHPGEILDEEFIKPSGMSRHALAQAIGVPASRINDICLGKRSVTPDTALRLATYYSVSPELWMGIQLDYNLAVTKDSIKKALENIRPRAL